MENDKNLASLNPVADAIKNVQAATEALI